MNSKSAAQKISIFLTTVASTSAAVASTCSPGFYDPAGGSACVAADPGFYVPVANADEQTPADPGFYVPTSGASAALSASPGYYVPNSGASVALSASPGYYVPDFGATEATIAPPGFYVPDSAASAATSALPGFYVPTSGATEATPVSSGYYTATSGADTQIPAGGITAPLTAALQTNNLFNNLSTDLLENASSDTLKLATGYQYNRVDQDALGSGKLTTDIGAIIIQANLLKDPNGNTGLQLAYGQHSLDNDSNLSNNGKSFEVAAFKSGTIGAGSFQAFAVYGQTNSDNKRTISIDADRTNIETLRSDEDVSWYGLRSQLSYPVSQRIGFVSQLGLLKYSIDAVEEVGSATLNGAPTTSYAALNVNAINYSAAPFKFGFDVDVSPFSYGIPLTLETGITGNFASEETIHATSAAAGSIAVPVTQSSPTAGLLGLRIDSWRLNGFNISGGVHTEIGADTTSVRAGINLGKTW